ncbi:hypothetical protein A3D77_03805 [Candidatus Gottesmanbacteria bacterium RIFCSPHIGHO2_02_FULL_39_11]|uniref:Uncharacterized protein n=1 Tax=Candidatus Gottesmanbacteria bacterium RIFCSPHIGHO2_02_FULL_39_11 TaxID=1798382 RepID=A0A1F5ZXF3_9BACT|nr:MAG: hypothetical protein A3D77_03805 [Candidatus Gottesmanbacteria bacterium RIFCSPHIGHO2_02_FULL_39_11]
MTAKKQKRSSVKYSHSRPLLSFSWVLVVYLLLFILIIGIVFTTGGVQKSPQSSAESDNPTSQMMSLSQYRETAIQELKKLSAEENNIPKIVSIEEVQWRDTSLGCPKEGMMYAQVITPGYKIHMELNGTGYIYHAGLNQVILCNR